MTQEQKPYEGLSTEFRSATTNICELSLRNAAWRKGWRDLSFQDGTRKFTFPIDGSGKEKLKFLDHYLFKLLSPKDVVPPHRNRIPHVRADLNKYRGWLTNRIVRQLQEESLNFYNKTYDLNSHPKYNYSLAEDIPKIVDDLYLFHCKITGAESNISKHDDLNALHDIIEPYLLSYPISLIDRAYAHARFLQTDTPEELIAVLPRGWQADDGHVTTLDGEIIIREGGANLIGVLEDETEVIHILNEAASLAYGSPRWCTAYRERETYFEKYKDGLINIIDIEGRRWQLHFRAREFKDAMDVNATLPALLERFKDLEETIKNYTRQELASRGVKAFTSEFTGLLYCAREFPEFRHEVELDRIRNVLKMAFFEAAQRYSYADESEFPLFNLYFPEVTELGHEIITTSWTGQAGVQNDCKPSPF